MMPLLDMLLVELRKSDAAATRDCAREQLLPKAHPRNTSLRNQPCKEESLCSSIILETITLIRNHICAETISPILIRLVFIIKTPTYKANL